MARDTSKRRGYLRATLLGSCVLLACLLIFVVVDTHARGNREELQRSRVVEQLHPYGTTLSRVIQTRVAAVEALAGFVSVESTSTASPLDAFAAGLYSERSGLSALLLAPGGVVEYSYPPSYLDSCGSHDLNADTDPRIAGDIARAKADDTTTISGPLEAPWGGQVLFAFRRVVRDGEYWGLAVGVIDMVQLLDAAGLEEPPAGLDMAIMDEDDTVFWGDTAVAAEEPATHQMSVDDRTWTLIGVPAGGWRAEMGGNDVLVRILGVLLSLGLGLITFAVVRNETRLKNRLDQELDSVAETQATLAASEERFRLLFERAPLAMGILEGERIELANKSLSRLLGYPSPEAMQGMSGMLLVAPAYQELVGERAAARTAGEDVPSSYPVELLSHDGQDIPVELSALSFEASGVLRTLAIAVDMRAQIAAEQVLRESVATYQALFDNSPLPMFEEDFSGAKEYLDGLDVPLENLEAFLRENPEQLRSCVERMRVVRANAAGLATIHAREMRDILGSMGGQLSAGSSEIFLQEVLAVAAGESTFHGQSHMPALDGSLLWLDVTWQVPVSSHDSYDRVYVSIIDLTEERRMRAELEAYRDDLERIVDVRTAELQATNEQLREATRAKDQFLAAMSHELRTPLNSIIGFSGTLLQGLAGDLNDEQSRQLEMVQNSGKHLLGLINQILDLSKIAAGEGELSLSTFDAAELACAALGEIGPAANAKGLEVSCDTRFDDPLIHSDRDRVHQILLNLLSNAVKFTSSGSVVLRGTDSADELEFIVSDTGRGIPRSERNRIFEPFQQIPGDGEAKPVGTGLGLAISRDLATMLGGTLDLVEKSEDGTEFKLCLPREAPDSPDAGGDSEPGSSVRGVE